MSFLLYPELYPTFAKPDLYQVGRARVKTTVKLLHRSGLLLYPELYPYPRPAISTQLPPLEGVGVEPRRREDATGTASKNSREGEIHSGTSSPTARRARRPSARRPSASSAESRFANVE